jgi:hypothetical protein
MAEKRLLSAKTIGCTNSLLTNVYQEIQVKEALFFQQESI